MSKYNDFICEIITNYGQHRKSQSNPDGAIYETHHIKPRCVGGTDDIYNLVDLTPREHYVAHMLLAEEYPNEEKIVCAWHFMSVIKQNRYQATPEEYEASRLAIIRSQSEPVYQLDQNGDIISCYWGAREAARQVSTSPSHIIECCNKKRLRAAGYYWQTVRDYSANGFSHKKENSTKQKVEQYDLNGNLIATYNSYNEAGRAVGVTGSAIRQCCQAENRITAGCNWKKG